VRHVARGRRGRGPSASGRSSRRCRGRTSRARCDRRSGHRARDRARGRGGSPRPRRGRSRTARSPAVAGRPLRSTPTGPRRSPGRRPPGPIHPWSRHRAGFSWPPPRRSREVAPEAEVRRSAPSTASAGA
jgi:hypothetical protein